MITWRKHNKGETVQEKGKGHTYVERKRNRD
jgi:hypothetical protein